MNAIDFVLGNPRLVIGGCCGIYVLLVVLFSALVLWRKIPKPVKMYPRYCAWCDVEDIHFIVDYCEAEGSTAICPHHLAKLRADFKLARDDADLREPAKCV